jgi:outer membrane protein assembly factor BamB
MHGSDVSLPPTAAWPTARYDAANTGFNPDASGPTGDVELAWRQSACTEAASGVVVSDGRAYAGGLVVDGATGRAIGGDWDAHMHTPTVVDGTLYTSAHDLEARDAATGELEWTFETDVDAGALPAPTVSAGTVYVLGSIDDPVVYAVDAETGDERWRVRTDGDVDVPVAVAGGVVYAVDEAATVYALDGATGEERWRATREAGIRRSAPVVADGRVYLGSADGGVLALRASDGATVWRRQVAAPDVGLDGPLAVADGTLYAVDPGGILAALDASTGRPRWHRSLDASRLGTPAVADGVVYLGTSSGAVLAVDAGDGRVRWRVETREVLFGDYTRAGVSGSPAVVDGVAYVATAPGDLYAIAER